MTVAPWPGEPPSPRFARADLTLTGLALHADRRDADKITKGLHLHP
jgi:hypothetical protein